MRPKSVVLLLAFAATSALAANEPQLKLVEDAPLLITPSAPVVKATLHLLNESADGGDVSLSIGPFSSDATHQIIPSVATIEPEHVAIEGRGRLPVHVTVQDIWPGAGASAPIRNKGTAIGTIKVNGFGFNVKPDGWKDGTPYPLRIHKDGGGQITLVNADAIPYDITWSLAAPGKTPRSEWKRIPALSAVSIPIEVDRSWFANDGWLETLFHEPDMDAVFSYGIAASPTQHWPMQFIKTKLTRGYWRDLKRPLGSYAVLIVLLALGGVCSLILTNAIPNRMKKIDLHDRLGRQSAIIRGFSSRLDSRVRVCVDVEGLRIDDALNHRWIWSPDYGALATECAADVTRLEKTVAVIRKLDAVARGMYAPSTPFVPTLLDRVRTTLAEAERILGVTNISDADVAKADAVIDKAAAILHGASELTPEFKDELTRRIAEWPSDVKSEFARKAIADLGLTRPDTVTPVNFQDVDAALSKATLFAQIEPTVDHPGAATHEAEADLIEALKTRNLRGWLRARSHARMLSEGIPLKKIKKAIEAGAFEIVVSPALPVQGQKAQFRIDWHDPELEDAAVLEEIRCAWDFGDEWPETGWNVAHYLANPEPYPVKVSFSVGGSKQKDIKVGKKPNWTAGHTVVQSMQLVIALSIAVAGLLTGALDQITKLELVPALIAVFMLGFSADQIKNVITKGTLKPE